MSLPPILLYPGGRLRRGGIDVVPPVVESVGSPNFFPGRPSGPPIAIVVHTMAGFLAGTDSVFNDPNVPLEKRVSAHYGVALDGRIHQYVQLQDRAWANGILETGNTWFGPAGVNPNDLTVSIETEDRADPNQEVTPEQFEATLRLCRHICATFPSIRFVTSHHVISPINRPGCCGRRWTGHGHLERLANAVGLELRV